MRISLVPTSLQAKTSAKFRKKYNPFNKQNAGRYSGLQDIAKVLYISPPEVSDMFRASKPYAEDELTNANRLKAIPHELGHLIFQHLFADDINPPVRISCTADTAEVAMSKSVWQQTKDLTPALKQEALLKIIMVCLAGPAMDELLQPQISDLNHAGEVADFIDVYLFLNQLNYQVNIVEEVCVDMWGGFPKVIREVFPNAKIVIDRFHVQKLVNKNLNKIRLKLDIKGAKNKILLMMAQSQLTELEKTDLEALLQASPVLRVAHELKENILNIYNSKITPLNAIKQMKKWLTSARIILGDAADTLSLHLSEICNYFKNRTTSGVTEGLNTRIKLILRQSYGFKNFDMMRDKLLVCLFK